MSQRKRWPNGAEEHRTNAIAAIQVALAHINEARRTMDESRTPLERQNWQLVEMMQWKSHSKLADAMRQLDNALHELDDAKNGI